MILKMEMITAFVFAIVFNGCTQSTKHGDKIDGNSVEPDSTELMKKYFERKSNKIPSDFARDFFGIEYIEKYKGCYSEDYLELGSLEIFVVRLPCDAGAFCEWKQLFVMDNGNVRSNFVVGKELGDQTFFNGVSYKFILDDLVELSIDKEEYEIDYESDDDEQTLVLDTSYYEYYSIAVDNGEVKKVENVKNLLRKYQETSYRVFEVDELIGYSTDELNLMRNEIFATYGYNFKTEKWKQYFSSKEWYQPKDVDVNSIISRIEKVNVERILEASKKK